MIRIGDKIITSLVRHGHEIVEVRHGLQLIWDKIKSCFGNGYWDDNSSWDDNDGWKD